MLAQGGTGASAIVGNNLIINKKIWDELPQDLKDAVHKAAMIAEEKQFEKQKGIENDYIEKV